MGGHFVHSKPRYGLQPDTADKIILLFQKQIQEARAQTEEGTTNGP